MFIENFERIARQAGKTPSGVCVEAGLHKNKSSYWKTHDALPKEEELERLAKVLQCTVSDFFRDPNKPRYRNEIEMMEAKIASGEWEYASEPGLDEYQQDFMKIYNSLAAKDRMLLMHRIYGFADEKGVEL